MLPKLIDFIQKNHPKIPLDDWLDSKYISLNNAQLKKIAQAIKNKELTNKPASACPATDLIFHFGSTLILIKKQTNGQYIYQAELAWQADFQSVHSTREKDKGFHFINFAFDDDFVITLLPTQKTLENTFIDKQGNQKVVDKAMPVLKAFMSAIS